jgi:2,4-dienoyl-CoA reductase-like NADH-dependent reductase (Old Yellow Enzyme family)
MAPMTRSMADDHLVATKEMAVYYARRAEVGLLISEGTVIRPDGLGYPNVPGIYTQPQIDGWKRVTDAVHERGAKIFAQLWHVGRVSHPIYLNGELPISPSAVPLKGRLSRRKDLEYGKPRALKLSEVPEIIDAFAEAGINAIKADFDGIEIHGANGYLVDQFLHHKTNRRTDKYGGSTENMARFALEVVKAISNEVGPQRVGIRLSPGAYHYIEPDERDPEVFKYLLKQLDLLKIAYVHTGIIDDSMQFDYLSGTATNFLRENYSGTVIGCGSYTIESATRAIANGEFDLIAIGRLLIANPDLVEKIRSGKELIPYDKTMLKALF